LIEEYYGLKDITDLLLKKNIANILRIFKAHADDRGESPAANNITLCFVVK